MTKEQLIGRFVREFNRHLMRFPSGGSGVDLPRPHDDREYLLYLHIPYCMTLCPFCTFHRVRFEHTATSDYFTTLDSEIERVADAGYQFDEVYVGGGTPTVLPDRLIAMLRRLRSRHAISGISIETNPDHLSVERLQALASVGVTRVSVGVQSFDDDLLKAMKRYESYGSGAEIIDRLRRVRGTVDTINVDMIFNLPRQNEHSLRRDLEILVDDVGADQVSFYPLMVSGSARGRIRECMGRYDPARERAAYELVSDTLRAAGYERTTAWCFSRTAGLYDEYISERDEYVGLGSGAFSYLRGSLYASTFSIPEYLERVAGGQTGTTRRRAFSRRNQMRYYLLMHLFSGTLALDAAERRFAGAFERTLWPELGALRSVGAIRDRSRALELTRSGYYLWVVLMREFFTGINKLREDMRIPEPRPAPRTTIGEIRDG